MANPASRVTKNNVERLVLHLKPGHLRRRKTWMGKLMALVCTALLGSGYANADEAACAPMPASQQQVADVLRQMYAAAQKDDLALFQTLATPDFYAFDGGGRFTGEALMGMVKKLHAQGAKFEWTVPDPDVHVICNVAWVTYTNKGSVETAGKKVQAEWLESAFLQYSEDRWRIQFFHSSPVPPPKQ